MPREQPCSSECLETAGINPDAAAGGLTASSLLGVGGLLMLPILTLPAVLGGSDVNHTLVNTALIGVAGFIVYIGLGILLLETDRPLRFVGRGAQWIWNKIRRHHAPLTGLDGRLLTQRDQIRGALGREWRQVLLLEVGRLGFDFLCLLATLRATGSEPHAWLVLLAYSAAGVIALIPATPGGLGIVEASLSGLLVLAGVSGRSAVLATLAYRLAEYWLPMVAGLVAYWLYRRRYGSVRFSEPQTARVAPVTLACGPPDLDVRASLITQHGLELWAPFRRHRLLGRRVPWHRAFVDPLTAR